MSQNTTPIITLEDKQGDQFFPVTHVDAVIDANGSPVSTLLSGKQNTLVSGTNIKTINNNSILGPGNINIQGGGITSGTGSEIKSLRDEHSLIPGTGYRITNYCATTSQSYTSSAEVYFDILLLATSENTFSEEAKAAMNSEGESEYNYFSGAGSNLDAGKIGYCIDNDMDRFAWAHTNGKGVIYRMIDEFGNDCPYDFKGIKFIINSTRHDGDGMDAIFGSTNQVSVFTFDAFYSYPSSPYDQDASVGNQNDFGYNTQYGQTARVGVINNKIEPAYDATNRTFRVQILNGNVFVDSDRSSLFGGFQENVLKQNCIENFFGSGATGNILNIGCYKNYFFDSCGYNFLDNYCNNNMFAYGSQHNEFGSGCNRNNNYASMNNVILGPGCYLNSFGDAVDCKLGSGCYYISLYNNENIIFENDCNNISITQYSYNIKFTSKCHHIDFGSTNQHDIVFKYPTYYIHFNADGSNVQIENLDAWNGASNQWCSYLGATSGTYVSGWHFGIVGGSGCGFYRDSQFSDYVVSTDYNQNRFLCTPVDRYGSVSLRKIEISDLPDMVRLTSLPEEKRPLTFEILTSGTITWKHYSSSQTIQYSKNGGSWINHTSTTSGNSISVSAGDTIMFKGSAWPATSSAYRTFGGTATFDAYGNPASLKYGTSLTGVEVLGDYCYRDLFNGCTGIRRGPILPASSLTTSCYARMFEDCTNLTSFTCLATTNISTTNINNWLLRCSNVVVTIPGLSATSYMYAITASGIPSSCIVKTTDGETFIRSSRNGLTYLTKDNGGNVYNTKSDAVTASGLSEDIFDTLIKSGYSNASLFFYESTNPVSGRIAAPIGGTFDNNTLEREVGWVCGYIYFGIYYDGNSGNYCLYGANNTPPIQ